jgi:hypothetical protein
MTTSLPYSFSSESAFNAFDKPQGAKSYVDWRTNMCTMLMSLHQWGMIEGSIVRPVPADPESVRLQQ